MKRELLRSASYSLTAAILFAVAAASTSGRTQLIR